MRGRTVAAADLTAGALAAGTLAVAGLGAATGFRATDGPVLCPFRLLTGYPCPLCGITRSVAALGAGDLGASLALHPLGVVVVPAAVLVLALVVVAVRRGSPLVWRQSVLFAAIAVFVGAWVLRLLTHLQ